MQILREYTTVHRVWRDSGWIYKQQPDYLTENEYWCLKTLEHTGYVPYCERVNNDTIKMKDMGSSQRVVNTEKFMSHLPKILTALHTSGIRHGDLTEYALIIRDDKPYIIDFAESRLTHDPRPDKRHEGDEHWLTKTMRELCGPQ